MAIRQRKYNIFIRPFIKANYGRVPVKIFAENDTPIYVNKPTPPTGGGCNTTLLNKDNDNTEYWTLYFTSNSYEQTHKKYTELLDEIGDDKIRMSSSVPFDIITAPRK